MESKMESKMPMKMERRIKIMSSNNQKRNLLCQ